MKDWRHRAACRDEDPELFFPVGTNGPALAQIRKAKAVCHRCPVARECLEWAITSGQDAGVWGGLSEDERRALLRQGRRTGQRIVTPEPEPLRMCSCCRTDQPVSQFQKNSRRQDKLSRKCVGCISRDRPSRRALAS
jgi:WhiB family redox-sensing transcriptional regulator